jgi:hypothetical protein
VTARPPDLREPERDLRNPEDPQPEHPEQEPGADRPGGRLAREAPAVPRIKTEHDEHHAEREQRVPAQERLEPLGVVQLARAEDPLRVEARQPKIVGHLRRPERDRPGDEAPRDDDRRYEPVKPTHRRAWARSAPPQAGR